jgi:hypothetical protein
MGSILSMCKRLLTVWRRWHAAGMRNLLRLCGEENAVSVGGGRKPPPFTRLVVHALVLDALWNASINGDAQRMALPMPTDPLAVSDFAFQTPGSMPSPVGETLQHGKDRPSNGRETCQTIESSSYAVQSILSRKSGTKVLTFAAQLRKSYER